MSRLLNVLEAAEAHRVEPDTIRRWIHQGCLPASRNPSGHYRIAEEDLLLALEPARGARAGARRGVGGVSPANPSQVDRGGGHSRARPK